MTKFGLKWSVLIRQPYLKEPLGFVSSNNAIWYQFVALLHFCQIERFLPQKKRRISWEIVAHFDLTMSSFTLSAPHAFVHKNEVDVESLSSENSPHSVEVPSACNILRIWWHTLNSTRWKQLNTKSQLILTRWTRGRKTYFEEIILLGVVFLFAQTSSL